MRCCGSEPRCRTCPVRLAAELRASLPQADDVPPHLADLPRCLHKYEPLFRPEVAATREATRSAETV
jgi:hypothetical protein